MLSLNRAQIIGLISVTALVQCFPFKKGFALRFIKCGTAVRTRVKPIVMARPWLYQKTMYVHLPESDGLKHEEYERPDSKNGIEGYGKAKRASLSRVPERIENYRWRGQSGHVRRRTR
jgi:hypothetical protein